MLDRIRIVMVETTHPGNIGAAARAMKTMGLSDLRLVSPKAFPNAEATARASGAADVLEQAKVCASLDEALDGAELVVGTSARQRRIPWPLVTARQLAGQVANESGTQVAILFGRGHKNCTPVNPDSPAQATDGRIDVGEQNGIFMLEFYCRTIEWKKKNN